MATYDLTIHTDQACRECGKVGVANESGLCLACATRTLFDRREPYMGKFRGRTIVREILSISLGGQIDRAGEEFPPRATVSFDARAVVQSIKYKFTKEGDVEEYTILVIDPESFRVRDIARGPEEQELPLTEKGGAPPSL